MSPILVINQIQHYHLYSSKQSCINSMFSFISTLFNLLESIGINENMNKK